MLHDLLQAQAAEIEPLASAQNGRRDLVRLGGGKDEDDMLGRLFEGLQQSVEGLGRQHVDFIDDVDFVATLGRPVADRFPQLADVVDAAVGGAVDFENVHRVALGDFPAVRTLIARDREKAPSRN